MGRDKWLCWSLNPAKFNIWEWEAGTQPGLPQAHGTGTLQCQMAEEDLEAGPL